MTRYPVLTPAQTRPAAQQPTETPCPFCGQVTIICPGCKRTVPADPRRSYCSATCRKRLKMRRYRKRKTNP